MSNSDLVSFVLKDSSSPPTTALTYSGPPAALLHFYQTQLAQSLPDGADLEELVREGLDMIYSSRDLRKSFKSLSPEVPRLVRLRYFLLEMCQCVWDKRNEWLWLEEKWLKLLTKYGVPSVVLDLTRQKFMKGIKFSEGIVDKGMAGEGVAKVKAGKGMAKVKAGEGVAKVEAGKVVAKVKAGEGVAKVKAGEGVAGRKKAMEVVTKAGERGGREGIAKAGESMAMVSSEGVAKKSGACRGEGDEGMVNKADNSVDNVGAGEQQGNSVIGGDGIDEGVVSKEVVAGVNVVSRDGTDEGETTPLSSARFSERHISPLTELLVSCSSKWRNISLSLNLPERVCADIQQRLHMYDITTCLSKVLSEWILGAHQHASPPTVGSLRKALLSQTVGLGRQAEKLEEASLQEHGILLLETGKEIGPEADECSSCHWSTNSAPLRILHQSLDIQVAEDKSTLLEVQVSSMCEDVPLTYQWMKGKSVLPRDSKHYFGTNRPILCVTNAFLVSQGTYSCAVTSLHPDSPASVRSRPISLVVSFPPATGVLVDMYSSLPDLQEDSWPPVSASTYVNLALIREREEIGSSDRFSLYTIQGDLDDIMHKKDKVSYEEAFHEYHKGLCVLIEGRPGSGKTTLTHKLCKDWARGVGVLVGAKLVFLISLRVLPSTATSIEDVLRLFYHQDHEMVRGVVERLIAGNGEGACFVLDGLDEYVNRESKTSVVSLLVQKKYLQRAMVIVASRHVATAGLRKSAYVRIEVVGFLQEQTFEYVDHYPFSEREEGAKSLKEYLTQHPNILRMCYLPVHVAMVCFLHDQMQTCLPRTETGVYHHFTLFTLLRKLRQSDKYAFLESMDDLDAQERDSFLALCKLAFDMTASSKHTFKRSELRDHFSGGTPFLGFLAVDSVATLYGMQNQLTFVHLTFQEYLAACHLSRLPSDQQLEVMTSELGRESRMKVVWKFYCGMASFAGAEKARFEKILSFYHDPWFHCQCSFESQNPSTCESVVLAQENKGLMFNQLEVSPSDYSVITYIISNSPLLFEEFCIAKCVFQEGISFFTNSLKLCQNLHHLDLSYNLVGDDGAEAIAGCLGELRNLYLLNLCRNNISDTGAVALASGLLSCTHLEYFHFGLNHIHVEGTRALCVALESCKNSLRELYFSESNVSHPANNQIGNDGAQFLSELLAQCTQLHSLVLRRCYITGKGLATLAQGLSQCRELRLLDLSLNTIGDTHTARAFSDGLKQCSKLQHLYLNQCEITYANACDALDCLRSLTELQVLDLNCNAMYGIGARVLADSLKCSYSLCKLLLTHNCFVKPDAEWASAIADILKQCRNLEALDLSNNGIDTSAGEIIGKALEHCSTLKELNLMGNFGNTSCFARGLEHCQNMRDLRLPYIDDEAMQLLGASCKRWSHSLEELWVQGACEVTSLSFKAFTEGLKDCHGLIKLNLLAGDMGDDGAKLLGQSLRHCEKLSVLYVSRNKIGDKGAQSLVQDISSHCKALKKVSMNMNKITEDCAKSLTKNCAFELFCMDRHSWPYPNLLPFLRSYSQLRLVIEGQQYENYVKYKEAKLN